METTKKSFILLPRVKVNYRLRDLLNALWILCCGGRGYRMQVVELLKRYFEGRHVLLTPSGRGALYYLLKSLHRRKVIVPAYTCNAVAEAAALAEKEIEFVECSPVTLQIIPELLRKVVDSESVFIATHQFGIPCDMEAIRSICAEQDCEVIEDVAAALGSELGGRKCGTFASYAFISFDSTKLVNVPLKGGAIILSPEIDPCALEESYKQEIKSMPTLHSLKLILLGVVYQLLRNNFIYRFFHFFNFQMRGRATAEQSEVSTHLTPFYRFDFEEWQAAIILPQLEKLEELIFQRRTLFKRYLAQLENLPFIRLPPADSRNEWCCIRFPLQIEGDKFEFYRECTRRGVDLAFSFTFLATPLNFKQAHQIAAHILNIPFYIDLSEAEIAKVISTTREVADNLKEHSHART